MNTNIEVLRELDELVEAARLLGVTQAKKGFGCYTYEDSRFERAMHESVAKHRAALLDWEAKQPAPQQPAAVDEVKETGLWRCTVCGRVGTVGRCCGEETREPFRPNTQVQPCRESAAALAAQPAVSAEPVAWVAADTLNSPHPTCVSSLAYMSQLDKDRGREYVPLYAAPMDAQQAEIEALRAEVDALREALTEVLRVNETDAGSDVKAWANAMLNAHAALEQENNDA